MATRRLPDAFQAELTMLPVTGILASISPTANSGFITSSDTVYLTSRSGSNLSLSTADPMYLGGIVDISSNYIMYQIFLEFNINIPTNAIIYAAELSMEAVVPTTEPFIVKASIYNYGTLTSSSWVPGASLLPGTQVGQTYVLQNQGFSGENTRGTSFDNVDSLRNSITPNSTLKIMLSTSSMEKTSADFSFASNRYTKITKSSIKLNINYVTAGELIAALIGAYWGIKVTIQ